MQPESKPLSIPDFNPLPMKTIQTLTLTACCLLISFYYYAQNLQFNSAVFYEYGGGQATGTSVANVVTTGTLTVAANQVLKITQVGGSIGAPNFVANCFTSYGGHVLINDKIVGFMVANGPLSELYLPTGEYTVGFTDSMNFGVTATNPACVGEVKGYISGILYDIVP
jgi:hypothetical protein